MVRKRGYLSDSEESVLDQNVKRRRLCPLGNEDIVEDLVALY